MSDNKQKENQKKKIQNENKPSAANKKISIKKRGNIRLIFSLISDFFFLFFELAIVGLFILVVGYFYFSQSLPTTDKLKNYAPKTITYFYSDDDRIIGEYYHERRIVVPLEKIPLHLKQAFLATEDAVFYEHPGIHLKGIIRAMVRNFQAGHNVQGASTITQQVVRGFLLTHERTYSRKIREMILAFRIEKNLSKDQILFLYVNHIYLGDGAYGVEAASQTYFGKSVSKLTLPEAAIIAGIAQSPSNFSPIQNPKDSRTRQAHVLKRMVTVGYISQEMADKAFAENLYLNYDKTNPNTSVTPYFTEHVRRLLEDKYGAESLYNDGWRIYTTVNIEQQEMADRAIAKGLWEHARRRSYLGPIKNLDSETALKAFINNQDKKLNNAYPKTGHLYQAVVTDINVLDKSLKVSLGSYEGLINNQSLRWALKKPIEQQFKKGDVIWVRVLENKLKGEADEKSKESTELINFSIESRSAYLQGALMSMEAKTGDIKAMVGGRDPDESQFNRATQSQRQPGSSFKPIIYTAGIEEKFTPGSVMIDSPISMEDGTGKTWAPMNADRKFRGSMDLNRALASSRNIIAIKVLQETGFKSFQKTATNLGFKEQFPESLAVALGSHGVFMPEIVTAFSAFPNMGEKVEPRYITRIEDRYGHVVEEFSIKKEAAIDPGTACSITWMLREAISNGTGGVVRPLNRPVAGKTGTTNDYTDAWFIGFTPEYITAVWLGTDRLRPRAVGEVGGRAAAPIFLYFMQEVLKDRPIVDFVVPKGAELKPGGTHGVCYKIGTFGTGFVETTTSAPSSSAVEKFIAEERDQIF